MFFRTCNVYLLLYFITWRVVISANRYTSAKMYYCLWKTKKTKIIRPCCYFFLPFFLFFVLLPTSCIPKGIEFLFYSPPPFPLRTIKRVNNCESSMKMFLIPFLSKSLFTRNGFRMQRHFLKINNQVYTIIIADFSKIKDYDSLKIKKMNAIQSDLKRSVNWTLLILRH